jgi:hypothetical protein
MCQLLFAEKIRARLLFARFNRRFIFKRPIVS